MRRLLTFSFAVLLAAMLAACATRSPSAGSGGSSVALPPMPDSTPYAALAAKLRSGDTLIDFTALRMSYAGTSAYDPYNVDDDLRKAMYEALDGGRNQEAARLADSSLRVNYLDVNAHVVAGAAAGAAGDSSRAQLHMAIARGLLGSIASTDGLTASTAMKVISVDEEYVVLRARGLRRESQALGTCGQAECDILVVTDPRTGQQQKLYFDVSLPMLSMRRHFEDK